MNLPSLVGFLESYRFPRGESLSSQIEFPTTRLHPAFSPTPSLLKWFNTVSLFNIPETFELLPGWHFTSVEESVEKYNIIAEMNRPGSDYQKALRQDYPDAAPNSFIDPLWDNIPILTDYSDGGCGIASGGETYAGKIIIHEIHARWSVGFETIDKLVETAAECRSRGIWMMEPDERYRIYFQIGRSLNPECARWRVDS